MRVIHDSGEMTAWAEAHTGVGLVPTMGFLHRGHASLMHLLRPRCARLVVSIYVNPLQFGPTEDLATYPRDLDGDLRLCAEAGVDAVFAPSSLYPPGFATGVTIGGVADVLEGPSRPGHFAGVATVVARLFGVTRCRLAAFGEKDYQQLQVIRRMVLDLALPVEIVPGPLVRDDDGVALSSRNTYLSTEDRRRARSLSEALFAVQAAARSGVTGVGALTELGVARLSVDRLEYLSIVDAESLAAIPTLDRPARALVAAKVGRTRLIDNVAVNP
jgi:pantoate--beta-alanine ligase